MALPSHKLVKLGVQLVEANFDEEGSLISLRVDGHWLPLSAPHLVVYPDHAPLFQPWDIERQCLDSPEVVATTCDVAVVSKPDCAEIAVSRAVGSASSVVTRFTVRPGVPALLITLEVDWQEPEKTFKMSFPTGYAGRMARFGAPFGSILRSQQKHK
jgi:alpha-mannosidase